MKKKLMVLALAALLLCGCLTVGVLAAEDVIELDLEIHLVGDVDGNGSATIADANLIKRSLLAESHNAYKAIEDSYDYAVADVDGNGSVTIADANLINRSLLPTTHPAYKPLYE